MGADCFEERQPARLHRNGIHRNPSSSDGKELSASPIDRKYESLVDTRVHSGPGLHYPVVAEIKKGTKINVVDEEKGWLKIESTRGNKPGYVEASVAKPVANEDASRVP